MTARQKRVKKAVEYLTRYMDTYDKQPGYLDYEDETIIDDVLYALGVGLGGKKYRWADGFKRFKAYLAKHISDGMTGDGHVRKAYVLYRKTGCVPLKKGPFLSDSQVERTLIEMLRSCPEADEYMVAKVTHDHDVWVCTAGDFLSRQEAKRSAEPTVGEDIAPADPRVNPQNGMTDAGKPIRQAPVDLLKGKVYLIKEDGADGYVGRGIMQDPNPAGYGKGFYGFALLDSPDDCCYGVFSSKDVIDATGGPDVEAAERSGEKFSVDLENPVTGEICLREFT